MMSYETKKSTSFADIISFCTDTQSERGLSPVTSHNDLYLETKSLHAKSPANMLERQRFASPLDKEAHDLAARKRHAVMDTTEKNWKVNLRSKIETDLADQVQQALAPILGPKKKDKKKLETQKKIQMMKLSNFYQQHKMSPRYSFESNQAESKGGGGGGGGGGFKYIDVNYIPQSRLLAGGGDTFMPREYKDMVPRSLANLRLPRRNGLQSHAIYGLDELARAQKHAANMRGGLDVTLLDGNRSGFNFLTLPKQDAINGLRPLVPNAISYNGISLPNYGLNRRCFQMYTKEGMNNMLNSRSRRNKLTHLGQGRYMDKRGVVLSRLGPFWPQGYGPVCQCPELKASCPKQENLGAENVQDQKSKQQPSGGHDPGKAPAAATQQPHHNGPASWPQRSHPHPQGTRSTAMRVNDPPPPTNNTHNNNNGSRHPSNQQPQPSPRDGPQGAAPSGNFKGTWRGKPVIYDCERSSRAPLPHSLPDGMDESLQFESRFESGNLRQVRRIAEYEYELVLRTDMYTNRHTQWYYFRLQKAKPGRTYKLNIINLLKKDSLYNYGMKPLVYSEHLASEKGLGWHRTGENIKYSSWNNQTRNAILSLDLQYYCLEFEVTFDWEGVEDDTVYLAHCYPYTYSDLRRHLDQMMSDHEVARHVKKEVLCETTAGNACFLLTITEFPDKEKDKYKDFHQEKQGVVLTARVHPGETQASWMMKGVLDFLTSNQPNARKLRQKYVFKIVPMLNPDGVIVGNYRTSLAARDLNRNYRHPRQSTFPTIWHTKQMVDQFNKDHPIILYCDLHGHSRKHMVFMYGCERKALLGKLPKRGRPSEREPGAGEPPGGDPVLEKRDGLDGAKNFVEERLFPWLMYRLAPTRFSFHCTKFAVRRSKESTGRVVMFRQMGILNSFTMEASFSGTKFNKDKGRHFNIDDFQLVGRKLCECVLEYSRVLDDPAAKSRAIFEMTREVAQKVIKESRTALKKKRPYLRDPCGHCALCGHFGKHIAMILLSRNPATTSALVLPNNINNNNKNKATSGAAASKTNNNNNNNKSADKPAPAATKSNPAGAVPRLPLKTNATVTSRPPKAAPGVPQVDEPESNSPTDSNLPPSQNDDVDLPQATSPDTDDVNDDVNTTDDVANGDVTETDMSCFQFLQQLNLQQLEVESESSSESNSDSEPELPREASSSGGKTRASQGGSGGRKKKRKKRQQQRVKAISAPSNVQAASIQQRKNAEEQAAKEALSKPKHPVNYPGFVNKYANRSNGGIPIFAQERIKERAARRLAELKLAEEDRRQQEHQLRQQLLMAGIQDGPSVTYEIQGSSESEGHNGYSEVCGVRYKVAKDQPRKVQYMVYNPYRSGSPTSSNPDPRPMVTMRFSPPTQLRRRNADELPFADQQKTVNGNDGGQHKPDIYTAYRVQAPAGRLSNQRVLNSLTEMSDSTGSPTEPSSSQASDVTPAINDVTAAAGTKAGEESSPDGDKFEPRSVVVPLQKYSLSVKKPWHHNNRTTQFAPATTRDPEIGGETSAESPPARECHPNVSELVLPPSMDLSDVMTAHMRYPAQVHRVEAMKPQNRGRTVSRGPPMVFGEPVVMSQKLDGPPAQPLPPPMAAPRRVEPRAFVRSASFASFDGARVDMALRNRRELTLGADFAPTEHSKKTSSSYEAQLLATQSLDAESDPAASERARAPGKRPRAVPQFVAVTPSSKNITFSTREAKGAEMSGVGGEGAEGQSEAGGRQQPFTVR